MPNPVPAIPAGPSPGIGTALAASLTRAGQALRDTPHVLVAGLVAATTLLLMLLGTLVDPQDLTTLYVVPILFLALRHGPAPALVASVLSVVASAIFIYPPVLSLRIASTHNVTDLIVFLFTSVAVGKLAHDARQVAAALAIRQQETAALYGFSRRLASASTPSAIYAAIREHLAAQLGERLYLVAPVETHQAAIGAADRPELPATVARSIRARLALAGGAETVEVPDPEVRKTWLARTLHPGKPELGLIVVDAGGDVREAEAVRGRLEAASTEAMASLERLDVETALSEGRAREVAEALREALIGSVTHELRTPLATVIGSTSILVQAPAIASDPRLAPLARLTGEAAAMLDIKIGNLIDAMRITVDGLRPHLAWVDPTDVLNAATRECAHLLRDHAIARDVPLEPPLIETDPVLLKSALRQVLDNAAKYAPAGSTVAVALVRTPEGLAIRITDRGPGMTADEIAHAFERFYRGPHQVGRTPGTGLGLWIANAFVTSCGGHIRIESAGEGCGTTISIDMPISASGAPAPTGEPDE